MDAPNGEWLSMVVATLVSAALLTAFVLTRRYPYAVIGCVILLSIWPVSLYRILDDAVGAAIGLVAAGAVLISSVVGALPAPGPYPSRSVDVGRDNCIALIFSIAKYSCGEVGGTEENVRTATGLAQALRPRVMRLARRLRQMQDDSLGLNSNQLSAMACCSTPVIS